MAAPQLFGAKSFFESVPESVMEFLINQSLKIVRTAPDDSLESVLRGVVNFRKELEYGWEEAILDGKWYRWPSEIKSQIFCSEKALTTYLLLKTLGVPAKYALVSDYQGTGLKHETVFVPEGDRLLLLDWNDVLPVEFNSDRLVAGNITIKKKDLSWIADEEVIPRVFDLRSGDSFIDALESGQQLYRRLTKEGQLEVYVQFQKEQQQLNFLYQFSPIVNAPSFYCRQEFKATATGITSRQQFGFLISGTGLKATFLPYDLSNLLNNPALSKDQLADMIFYVWYDDYIQTNSSSETPAFVSSSEERAKYLAEWGKIAVEEKDDFSGLAEYFKTFLQRYDQLSTMYGPHYADRLLDFEITRLSGALEFPEIDDLMAALFQKTGIRNLAEVQIAHVGISLRNIAPLISVAKSLECQQRLCYELARRTRLPYHEIKPAAFLELTADFQKNPEIWGE